MKLHLMEGWAEETAYEGDALYNPNSTNFSEWTFIYI